jgi:hypothetical protein
MITLSIARTSCLRPMTWPVGVNFALTPIRLRLAFARCLVCPERCHRLLLPRPPDGVTAWGLTR